MDRSDKLLEFDRWLGEEQVRYTSEYLSRGVMVYAHQCAAGELGAYQMAAKWFKNYGLRNDGMSDLTQIDERVLLFNYLRLLEIQVETWGPENMWERAFPEAIDREKYRAAITIKDKFRELFPDIELEPQAAPPQL